jgi:hypothetical protein
MGGDLRVISSTFVTCLYFVRQAATGVVLLEHCSLDADPAANARFTFGLGNVFNSTSITPLVECVASVTGGCTIEAECSPDAVETPWPTAVPLTGCTFVSLWRRSQLTSSVEFYCCVSCVWSYIADSCCRLTASGRATFELCSFLTSVSSANGAGIHCTDSSRLDVQHSWPCTIFRRQLGSCMAATPVYG